MTPIDREIQYARLTRMKARARSTTSIDKAHLDFARADAASMQQHREQIIEINQDLIDIHCSQVVLMKRVVKQLQKIALRTSWVSTNLRWIALVGSFAAGAAVVHIL